MEEVDVVRTSFQDIPHSIDNPVWKGGMRLEASSHVARRERASLGGACASPAG